MSTTENYEILVPEVVNHGSEELRARLLRLVSTGQEVTTPILREKVEAHIAIHGITRRQKPTPQPFNLPN